MSKGRKGAKVTGRGPSSRENARELREISPVGRNDNNLSLRAWRFGAITFFCHYNRQYEMLELNTTIRILIFGFRFLLRRWGSSLLTQVAPGRIKGKGDRL